MKHLTEAKKFAQSADRVGISVDWAQVSATIAIAHVLIAICERMKQNANLALASQVDQDAVGWHDINDNLL